MKIIRSHWSSVPTQKAKSAPQDAQQTTDYRNQGIGYQLNFCPECGRKVQEVSNNSPKVGSDSGELIRCKGCRYKERKGVDYFCDHITGEEIMVSPNDYCSWAEKEVTL